ncbi:MAG TPA: outer membrane beta-barrel protein [Bryobacteraceae bacterium]|nr:outer membrane beta-barrel protein [Bryobacteraceae bacterium]
MKRFSTVLFLASLAVAPAALAQRWEVGVAGGGSFYTSETVQNAGSNGSAGFNNGFAVSGWLGNNTTNFIGGELRYDFERPDLHLSSGGTSVNFSGMTNAVHYDFLLHFAPSEAHVRPFVAAGGGVKVYSGTGTELPFQPLSNVALLTKTSQLEPVVSVGGGIKVAVSKSAMLRLEVHDYLSPFPNNVIAPAPGGKISGWLSDFVVSAGLSFGI